ncbi:MAG: hypothetical protein B6I31_01515 [Desulfobacteraceae bacterium 4572_19]|nr:MAG: hypothetical protein B6I31_01515 [Desulfobacteraceae bacterium 4572_19]
MIAERISSWSMLPVNEIKNNIEKQPLLSEVYITDSLPAIDYIIEKTPSVKLVFSINLTPAIKMVREKENKDKVDIWQDKLLNCLTDLAKNDNLSLNDNGEISIENNTDIWKSIRNVPDIQNIGKPVSLKIYLDNKICPSVFFANLSGKDIPSPLSLTTQTEIKNTVLVLIS